MSTRLARQLRVARATVLLIGAALGALDSAGAQRRERFTSWTHPVFPVAEYISRRATIMATLGANDMLLVPSAEGTSGGETFRQADDFEYFAGLEIVRSMLVIDGQTRRTLLFVPATDGRFDNPGRPNDFPGRAQLGDPALRALSGVDAVLPDSALPALLAAAAMRGATVHVNSGRSGGRSAAPTVFVPAPTPGELLGAHLGQTYPGMRLANAFASIARLRMVKSTREIARLRESARITSIAIARGAERVRAGTDERALTGAFTADCLALGAQRDAFAQIIKSGENSLWPWRILGAHYDRRNRQLRDGELVIFDVGCERDHYIADIGRTVPVNGVFTARQRELVEMVTRISDAVIAAAKPGVTLAALQAVAAASMPAAARPYMQAPHYFGHHIGLSSGDPSLPDEPLAAGMVFTIEPWYYNRDDGAAVFIEDEILITPTGSENLSAMLPRDAAGLEALRGGRDPSMSQAQTGRTTTRDGVLSFAVDRAAGSVRVHDLLNGMDAASTPVCPMPHTGALTPDDVSFVVHCDGARTPVFVNTASFTVVNPPVATRATPPVRRVASQRRNEVVIVGTIHGEHRTSSRFSLDVLRRLLRALRPDYVLTEISPNRLDAAMDQYRLTGTISEPRVMRFPEYIDVLFPLTKSMRFTIVPTAGWSRPMDAYRTAALKRIEADPSRAVEWQEYQQATRRADSLTRIGGADNPYFINSEAYDSLQIAAHEPYNRLFNSELGPGGWDNINVSHYGNIARTLDAHRGEGKRFVITYGAGHKEWFMRELRKRTDITILELAPFLRRIGAN